MIINSKKISVLCIILLQCSFLQAITQNQAYLGSALFATAGALLTGKSENPPFILAASALAGAAGYFLYLRKLTPVFRMNQASANT